MPAQPGYSMKKILRKRYKNYNRKGNLAKAVEQVLNRKLELKHHAFGLDSTYGASVYTCMTQIAQGDSSTSRDGNKVLVKGLKLRWNAIVADATNLMRFVIFTWNNGATAPTTNDVVDAQGTYGPLGYYKKDGDVSYKVLYDKIINLDTYNPQRTGIIDLKFPSGIEVSYDGSSSTSYGTRQIWCMIMSDSGAVAHPAFQCAGFVFFQEG